MQLRLIGGRNDHERIRGRNRLCFRNRICRRGYALGVSGSNGSFVVVGVDEYDGLNFATTGEMAAMRLDRALRGRLTIVHKRILRRLLLYLSLPFDDGNSRLSRCLDDNLRDLDFIVVVEYYAPRVTAARKVVTMGLNVPLG